MAAERERPTSLLRREDKWHLGNGRGAMWAPPFPDFLDAPGFWDEAYIADVRLERLFTVFLVPDGAREPLALGVVWREWFPDRLVTEYISSDGRFSLTETRVIVGAGSLVSELEIRTVSGADVALDLLLWSMQATDPSCRTDADRLGQWVEDVRRTPEGFALDIGVRQRYQTHPTGVVSVALGADREPASSLAALCQATAGRPEWRLTPFSEKLRAGEDGMRKLTDEMLVDVGPGPPAGAMHLGLHYRLELPAEGTETIRLAATLDATEGHARVSLPKERSAADSAAEEWREYLAEVPHFACSDPFLTNYYWYRWYGIRLLTVDVATPPLAEPCVFEGIGYFRRHISYSAQVHAFEARWMRDPRLARGSILNFTRTAQPDGSFPAYVCRFWVGPQEFYHADWGRSVLSVHELHPDLDFLAEVYEPLAGYARYFDTVRDPEATGLYDVINQDETGQEYAPRYLFAHPEADLSAPIRLKGVDAAVYLYRLKHALGYMADQLGRREGDAWRAEATKTGEAIDRHMWSETDRLYVDVSSPDLRQSPYKAAVGFYPFLTDLPGAERLVALRETLRDPKLFATPWPVPSASLDDPFFSAEAEWKGRRMSCPWNGRVWPMTNSHVIEALAKAAETDPAFGVEAARMVRRFVEMMCFDQDPARPNCFEHYNPLTGEPCTYRGFDDYQHSWVVDLILKYVVGVRPSLYEDLVVDPLPFGLEHFEADRIPFKGRTVSVNWEGDVTGDRGAFEVRVDGELAARADRLERIAVSLED